MSSLSKVAPKKPESPLLSEQAFFLINGKSQSSFLTHSLCHFNPKKDDRLILLRIVLRNLGKSKKTSFSLTYDSMHFNFTSRTPSQS